MRFSAIVAVRIECKYSTGRYRFDFMPTIQIEAPTERDARARLDDIVAHLPTGSNYMLVEI
jgi:hypothetical protein